MELPARYEGAHLCIGLLVQEEAKRMRACAVYTRENRYIPAETALAALEDKIWQWLRSGWTRVSADGVLVHWHPGAGAHVPFDKALHDYYTASVEDVLSWVAHVRDQRAAGHSVKLQ